MIKHFGLDRQYSLLREQLLDATNRVLSSGILLNGPETDQFETWLCKKTDTSYAITVHSGTQALEIIGKYLASLSNVFDPAPTHVCIPNLTYPATMNAMVTAGLTVELLDTDSNGLGDYSKCSMHDVKCLVGLYGAKPDFQKIVSIDWNRQWSTIVDGAQHWLVADGDVGLAMAISFDPTKNLAGSGNGGAIVTNTYELVEFAREYKDNGKSSVIPGWFPTVGTNSKLSEQECAHLLVKTRYINDWQERRKQIRLFWCEAFKNLPIRCLSAGQESHADQKFVLYSTDRNEIVNWLLDHDIQVKMHYPYTLCESPIATDFKKPDLLSVSVMLSRGVFSLPMYPELTDAEVEYIAKKVLAYFDK